MVLQNHKFYEGKPWVGAELVLTNPPQGPSGGSLGCLVGLQGVLGGLLGRPWSKLSRTRNSSFHRGKTPSWRQRGRLLAPNRLPEGTPKTQKCRKISKARKQRNLYKETVIFENRALASMPCHFFVVEIRLESANETIFTYFQKSYFFRRTRLRKRLQMSVFRRSRPAPLSRTCFVSSTGSGQKAKC